MDGDGVDGTDAGGELRVQLGVLGHFADEFRGLFFLAIDQDRLAGVLVALEPLPLGDALEHTDTGLAIEFDSHALASPGATIWLTATPTV